MYMYVYMYLHRRLSNYKSGAATLHFDEKSERVCGIGLFSYLQFSFDIFAVPTQSTIKSC